VYGIAIAIVMLSISLKIHKPNMYFLSPSMFFVDNYSQLLYIILLSLINSLGLAYITIIVLKNPLYASKLNFTKSYNINNWRFHTISKSTHSNPNIIINMLSYIYPISIFQHLVSFLHGALGLLPSEVIYGLTITDNTNDLLKYGHSYVITINSLDLHCEWWSLTLYGDDLFLIPNEKKSYSINSIQLNKLHNTGKDKIEILVGPTPPSTNPSDETYGMPYIPLPTKYQYENMSAAVASKHAPRFVLRGMYYSSMYIS
jgi:hypothetical protein